MTRALLLAAIFLLISKIALGQCYNPPTVTLRSTSGTTCESTPIKISGNTFGGSATRVTITTTGSGSVTPSSTTKKPFDITYTPSTRDAGIEVIITVTTNIPKGTTCTAATATYSLTVTANPSIPVVSTITQPDCKSSTGSVELSGLPSDGTWTIVQSPGGKTFTGSGNNATISGLPAGTFSYKVTNSGGCTSNTTESVVINPQPTIPAAPVLGSITQPTCSVPAGSVILNGLPSAGSWTITINPGAGTTTGSGSNATISGLSPGTYTFTVVNSAGCSSVASASAVINTLPGMPSPPIIGTITQPGNGVSTGSVNLSGLPGNGSWTLIITPGNTTVTGSGTTKTITNLAVGTYSITVTNSAGCKSGPSATFEIQASAGTPVILITDPAPVCFPSTVDLTNPKITAGSTSNLTYTYWTNQGATIVYPTPSSATVGIYYIKGTTSGGSFAIEPVVATVLKTPAANAGPDQIIVYPSGTTLNAIAPLSNEIGVWSLISGSCEFTDASNGRTSVSGLSKGVNILLWTVTNGVCPAASDTIKIIVRDKAIPTLITPNMDGKNDFFVVKNPETPGKLELYIFDRRGVQVYKSLDYNNTWNGIDYNGHQLPEDTYFYILKTENGPAANGYIVVRR